jgi:hypothetical protein
LLGKKGCLNPTNFLAKRGIKEVLEMALIGNGKIQFWGAILSYFLLFNYFGVQVLQPCCGIL